MPIHWAFWRDQKSATTGRRANRSDFSRTTLGTTDSRVFEVLIVTGPGQVAKRGCITCSREFGGDLTICPHDGTHLTPLQQDDLLGTILDGRYEMQEVLGGGGMGLVYKARHRLMNRTVAIKVLHKHMVSSADALKRFRLEAEAVSCLNVPNILTVYDFGVSMQGQPYMVMDYLAGTTLGDVLETEGRLDIVRSLHIFKQVCFALEHAHEKNVIHRDLKPSNIMLVDFSGQRDFVKIVDFGIAKLLGRAEGELEQLTRTGEVFGSPLFMSPEQCRGKPLDPRTDIYSLGSVMYLTLSGRPLFEGDEVLDLFFKQSTEQPAPFSVVCPELCIPSEIETVIFRSLAKEPGDRFQSMAELRANLEALEQWLTGSTNRLINTTSATIIPTALASNAAVASQARQSQPGSTEANEMINTISANANLPTPATTQLTIQLPALRNRKTLLAVACLLAFSGLLALSFFLGQQHQVSKESPKLIEQSLPKLDQGANIPVPVKEQPSPARVQSLTKPGQDLKAPPHEVQDASKRQGGPRGAYRASAGRASEASVRKVPRVETNVRRNKPFQPVQSATSTPTQNPLPPIAPPIDRLNSQTTISTPEEVRVKDEISRGVDTVQTVRRTEWKARTSRKAKGWAKSLGRHSESESRKLLNKAVRFLKDTLD